MNEYMLFIRAKGNPVAHLTQEKRDAHIEKVGNFIGAQVSDGKMKSAQPLVPEGSIVSNEEGHLVEVKFNESEEAILGYYHLQAADLKEAISIAKSDPRFEDGNWKIEVRPVMKVEGINE